MMKVDGKNSELNTESEIVKEHSLSNAEVRRYSRQILVQEFGVHGQERLRSASLLIVGAGGLGCPVGLYCAGAGIGQIGIVDGDVISSDNLHRQIAYDEHSVGQSKAKSLKESLQRLNGNIRVNAYEHYLSAQNALDIVSSYDIIADCTDNVATRYLVNDACVLARKPLVSGSAVRWDGQLSVFGYGEDCPCYRCVFPDPPPVDATTNCSESGVIGPVVGVIGCMQATEIIKIAATGTCSFAGLLYMFDGCSGMTKTIKLRRRKLDCILCSKSSTISKLNDCLKLYECAAEANRHVLRKNDRIGPLSYSALSKNSEEGPYLIDTRPLHEFDIGHLPHAINIPMSKLCSSSASEIIYELDTDVDKMRERGG